MVARHLRPDLVPGHVIRGAARGRRWRLSTPRRLRPLRDRCGRSRPRHVQRPAWPDRRPVRSGRLRQGAPDAGAGAVPAPGEAPLPGARAAPPGVVPDRRRARCRLRQPTAGRARPGLRVHRRHLCTDADRDPRGESDPGGPPGADRPGPHRSGVLRPGRRLVALRGAVGVGPALACRRGQGVGVHPDRRRREGYRSRRGLPVGGRP